MKLQRDLRERQAQLDTAQRTLAAAKRAADSAGTKVTPELKTQIAAVEKELTDITREMGAAAGGRGGAGRGGGGGGGGGALAAGGGAAGGGGRGGRGGGRGAGGGAAAPTQAGAPDSAGGGRRTGRRRAGERSGSEPDRTGAAETFRRDSARRPRCSTRRSIRIRSRRNLLQTLPAELQKQGDRVKKVSTDQLPALIKALKDAGVDVKMP